VALTLEESARLCGRNRWIEARLFEVLGGWVPSTPEAEVKLMFDRHSQHSAWRAAQWWDRLPVVAGVDRDELVVAPSPGWAQAMDALARTGGTAPRLAAAYRAVMARQYGAYERDRSLSDGPGDASTARTLAIVQADLERDWLEGEVLLQLILRDGTELEAASRANALVERLLL
jgi:hypothetical protein